MKNLFTVMQNTDGFYESPSGLISKFVKFLTGM